MCVDSPSPSSSVPLSPHTLIARSHLKGLLRTCREVVLNGDLSPLGYDKDGVEELIAQIDIMMARVSSGQLAP